MTQSLTLSLPWPDVALSPNGRFHWAEKSRAVKKARDYAWGMTLAAMGPLGIVRASWVGPIEVVYTLHPLMDRNRDDDNLVASFKAYRDGIARALGVDDSIFRTMPLVYGAKAKPACVEVTLTPAMVQVPVKGVIR
jgi:crossover junction endodeoxyribonuclease RusA